MLKLKQFNCIITSLRINRIIIGVYRVQRMSQMSETTADRFETNSETSAAAADFNDESLQNRKWYRKASHRFDFLIQGYLFYLFLKSADLKFQQYRSADQLIFMHEFEKGFELSPQYLKLFLIFKSYIF